MTGSGKKRIGRSADVASGLELGLALGLGMALRLVIGLGGRLN